MPENPEPAEAPAPVVWPVVDRTTLPKDTPLDDHLEKLVADLANCHFADQVHCERNFDRQKAYWLLRGFLDSDDALAAAHDVRDAAVATASGAVAEGADQPAPAAVAPSITPVPDPVAPVVPAAATAEALATDPGPAATAPVEPPSETPQS